MTEPATSPTDSVIRSVDPDWTVELLRRAVQVPSVTGEEAPVASLLQAELDKLGLDQVELFDFAPGRANVWGVLKGSGDGGALMLVGHHDTVHVRGWTERWRGTERESPFSGAIVDGELWGRGSADQKAGIVSAISAVRAIREAGMRPRGDLILAFVGDEESGEPGSGLSDGMKAVAARIDSGEIPRADFAIYTEPTGLNVYTAQMGFMIADVTVKGETAYFGRPWLGVDAVRGAHRLLSELFAHNDEIWDRDEHPLLGRAFLLVTAIEGGGYIAVPERCKISLIRKVLPSETLDSARSELESIVQKLAIRTGVKADIAFTASRDHRFGGTPAEASPDLPAVRLLMERIRQVAGREARIEGAPYWSEIPFLHALGIAAVFCGPGDIMNAHTVYERVEVRQVVDAARVFAAVVADHCGLEEAT